MRRTTLTLLLSCALLSNAPLFAAPFNPADYHGKVLYVDFWASWCVPCQQSFPWMNSLHQKYAAQGLQIVAISVDDTRKAMDDFLQQYPADFSVVHDDDKQISANYPLIGMPTSFLYDRNGKLIGSHAGYNPKDQQALEAYLLDLLQQ